MTTCTVGFNAVDLYNDIEDSDVKIELDSGEMIHAHKIILKRGSDMCKRLFSNKMLESETGVIKFPEHPDDVVVTLIKFLYGVAIAPNQMDFHNWVDLFNFANYLQVTPLINFLDLNYPDDPPIDELVELAWSMDRHVLMCNSVMSFLELYNDCTGRVDDVHLDQIAGINFEAYKQFRRVWIESGCDQYLLFELDCHYTATNCDAFAEKIEMLNVFIPDIQFDKFHSCELDLCKSFPLLRDLPMVRHLIGLVPGQGKKITGIGSERGMPDSRSLMYGQGQISARDPRTSLVAPIRRATVADEREIMELMRNI
jgi:hypothetical protein